MSQTHTPPAILARGAEPGGTEASLTTLAVSYSSIRLKRAAHESCHICISRLCNRIHDNTQSSCYITQMRQSGMLQIHTDTYRYTQTHTQSSLQLDDFGRVIQQHQVSLNKRYIVLLDERCISESFYIFESVCDSYTVLLSCHTCESVM